MGVLFNKCIGWASRYPSAICDWIIAVSNAVDTGIGGGPTGPAGGSLAGTYPNPSIAAGAVGSTEIANGSIVNVDVAAGAALDVAKLAAGGASQVLTTVAGVPTWAAASSGAPSGPAGGSLAGTYPNPSIAAGAVGSTEIANGSIVDVDIGAGAAVTVSKLAAGANTQVLTTVAGVPTWAAPAATGGPPTGAAGGSLAGTYPNPSIAAGAIGSTEIANGSIVNIDIGAAAAIAATKLAGGTALGQVLTNFAGNVPTWAAAIRMTNFADAAQSITFGTNASDGGVNVYDMNPSSGRIITVNPPTIPGTKVEIINNGVVDMTLTFSSGAPITPAQQSYVGPLSSVSLVWNGTNWDIEHPQLQKGSAALIAGVSPAIPADVTGGSIATATLFTFNGAAGGMIQAFNFVNGTKAGGGSFQLKSVAPATGATVVTDIGVYMWHLQPG